MAEVRQHLNEKGLLLITIPNINCIGRYIFKENWEWVLPWNLHFYYPKTLKTLIENRTVNKILSRYARLSTILLVNPIVLAGFVLGLNDNMTLLATRD